MTNTSTSTRRELMEIMVELFFYLVFGMFFLVPKIIVDSQDTPSLIIDLLLYAMFGWVYAILRIVFVRE